MRKRYRGRKVIHAKRVDPERVADTGALTGEPIFYGDYGEKDWQVRLDLREYALAASALMPWPRSSVLRCYMGSFSDDPDNRFVPGARLASFCYHAPRETQPDEEVRDAWSYWPADTADTAATALVVLRVGAGGAGPLYRPLGRALLGSSSFARPSPELRSPGVRCHKSPSDRSGASST